MLTLESRCIPVGLGVVLIFRTLPDRSKYQINVIAFCKLWPCIKRNARPNNKQLLINFIKKFWYFVEEKFQIFVGERFSKSRNFIYFKWKTERENFIYENINKSSCFWAGLPEESFISLTFIPIFAQCLRCLYQDP